MLRATSSPCAVSRHAFGSPFAMPQSRCSPAAPGAPGAAAASRPAPRHGSPRIPQPHGCSDQSPAPPAQPHPQHPRGAIRQPHRHALQRIAHHRPHSTQPALAAADAAQPRRAPGGPAHAAPPPAPDTAARSSPSTHPAAPSAARAGLSTSRAYTIPTAAPDQALRRQRRALTPHAHPPATLVNHGRQPPEDLLAALQDPGPPLNACTTHTRAKTGSRSKNPRIAHSPRRTRSRHAKPSKPAASELPGDHTEEILEDRREALLAVGERLIERPPRDPRTRDDIRHRRIRPPQLIDRPNRRGQQPRALNLSDPRTLPARASRPALRPARRTPIARPHRTRRHHVHRAARGTQTPTPRAGTNRRVERARRGTLSV